MTHLTSSDNLVYTSDFNLYEAYEKQSNSTYIRKCINGKKTSCGNCVGYCRYERHPGFLTAELRREHNCINKKCFYYLPKPNTNKKKLSQENSTILLGLIGLYTKNYKAMKVVRLERNAQEGWDCFYVSITNAYQIIEIEKELCSLCSTPIKLIRLNYDFEKVAQLIIKN